MRGRPVIEVIILTFTFTVAALILLVALSIIVVEILNPEADTGPVAQVLVGVIWTLVGALLGMLIRRPNGEDKK